MARDSQRTSRAHFNSIQSDIRRHAALGLGATAQLYSFFIFVFFFLLRLLLLKALLNIESAVDLHPMI
jgi:hypothetical protein